jgi:hypothetical protein
MDFHEIKISLQDIMEAQTTPLPVVFENSGFDPKIYGKSGFFAFLVREGSSQKPVNWKFPETSEQRKSGEIHVIIRVPLGTGDESLEIVLSTIKSLFLGKTITTSSGLVIRIQQFTGEMAEKDPPWYQKLAILPFIASYN